MAILHQVVNFIKQFSNHGELKFYEIVIRHFRYGPTRKFDFINPAY